jgi:hypothetical protein
VEPAAGLTAPHGPTLTRAERAGRQPTERRAQAPHVRDTLEAFLGILPRPLALRFGRKCASSVESCLHAQRSLCGFVLGREISLSVRDRRCVCLQTQTGSVCRKWFCRRFYYRSDTPPDLMKEGKRAKTLSTLLSIEDEAIAQKGGKL